MGFIFKLGVAVLIISTVFYIFFGDVTFAPFGSVDYPAYYFLYIFGIALLCIGIGLGPSKPARR